MQPVEQDRAHSGSVLPLAHGELSEVDAAELLALQQLIEERGGLHCRQYKEKCIRRRIAVRMRACGVHTYADYGARLARDAEEFRRLLDTITINVSKFFRNAETWRVVSEQLLPELFARQDRPLRVWSAGTAAGEEAFTLAMLVLEYAEANELDASHVRIRGTDIDHACLAQARRAEYGAFAFTETPDVTRSRWFVWNGTWRPRDNVRALVDFAEHDLIRDPMPRSQHLIVCRNVLIYFERSAQEQLFTRFAEALAPGGYLVLGKVETLFGPAAGLFQPIVARERVYRRR